MVTYEELYEVAKNTLSEERFKHTLGVVERAIEYAEIYNVNVEDAKKAAILHDIAKEYSDEENLEILKRYNIQESEIEFVYYKVVHGKIGAIIAKNEYQLSEDIVNAISFHTTGRENMSMLEKIIYLADATEKNRVYSPDENEMSLEELVNLIKADIDRGLAYVMKWVLQDVLSKNRAIHLDSVKAYNFYKK